MVRQEMASGQLRAVEVMEARGTRTQPTLAKVGDEFNGDHDWRDRREAERFSARRTEARFRRDSRS